MALMANDAADRVEQLIALTARLSDLVAKEAAAFGARDFKAADAAREEAAPLANLYRQETAKITADPNSVAAAPAARRAALAQATEKLHGVLDAHAKSVAALRELTDGLVRSIADYVAHERAAQTGYGPGGAQSQARAGSAITLNKLA